MENTTASGPGPDAVRVETSNGVPGQSAHGSTAADSRQQAYQRAEELVDRWGDQIGQYASSIGHGFLRLFSRAREEAEDIWAEAQAVAQRRRSKGQSQDVP
jgi:hypothetical protein